MANDIFTPVGFSTNVDTYTFDSSDQTKYLHIKADTEAYDEIKLNYRLKFYQEGFFYKTVLVQCNMQGEDYESWYNTLFLPAVDCYARFDLFYSESKYTGGTSPGLDWFNVEVYLNKSTGANRFYFTNDNGDVLLDHSYPENRERNWSRQWMIKARDIGSTPYSFDLDLTSVKITLDGTEYYLKERKPN